MSCKPTSLLYFLWFILDFGNHLHFLSITVSGGIMELVQLTLTLPLPPQVLRSFLSSAGSLPRSSCLGCSSTTCGCRCGNAPPTVVLAGVRGLCAVPSCCISTWHWVFCGMELLAPRGTGKMACIPFHVSQLFIGGDVIKSQYSYELIPHHVLYVVVMVHSVFFGPCMKVKCIYKSALLIDSSKWTRRLFFF